MNHELLDLILRSAAIPSMPQVVTRFMEISSDPDCDAKSLTMVLSTDPGIASEVLRLANSALFGVTREVRSLQQAIALLGLGRVRSLVIGRYLVATIDQVSSDSADFSLSYYWRRSLSTAILAARLSDCVEPCYREEAFMAGLLADTGILILRQALPEYNALARLYGPRRGDDLVRQELATLRLTHADVSARLLNSWLMPDVIVEGVRLHHHDPLPAGTLPGPGLVATIVSSAAGIARLLCERPDVEEIAAVCDASMKRLNLTVQLLQGIIPDIERKTGEFALLLKLDIIPSAVYARICDVITQTLAQVEA